MEEEWKEGWQEGGKRKRTASNMKTEVIGQALHNSELRYRSYIRVKKWEVELGKRRSIENTPHLYGQNYQELDRYVLKCLDGSKTNIYWSPCGESEQAFMP